MSRFGKSNIDINEILNNVDNVDHHEPIKSAVKSTIKAESVPDLDIDILTAMLDVQKLELKKIREKNRIVNQILHKKINIGNFNSVIEGLKNMDEEKINDEINKRFEHCKTCDRWISKKSSKNHAKTKLHLKHSGIEGDSSNLVLPAQEGVTNQELDTLESDHENDIQDEVRDGVLHVEYIPVDA